MSLTDEEKEDIIDILSSGEIYIRDPIILVDGMTWQDRGRRGVYVVDQTLFSGMYIDDAGQWHTKGSVFHCAVEKFQYKINEVGTLIYFDEMVGRIKTTQDCDRPKDAFIVNYYNDADFMEKCVQAIQLGCL